MAIENYFSDYLPQYAERNAEYMARRDEAYRHRQKIALKDAEDSYRQLTDDDVCDILKLHLKGYSNAEIGRMKNVPKGKVFRALQLPLARYLAGVRGRKVLKKNKNLRILPNAAAILAAIENRGEEVDKWVTNMVGTGMTRQAVNRLIGVRKQQVSIDAAVLVAEIFGKNVDELFFYADSIEDEKK